MAQGTKVPADKPEELSSSPHYPHCRKGEQTAARL